MKKKLFLTGSIMLVVFSVFCCLSFFNGGFCSAEEVRGVTKDTITIGAIIDQTGPAASVGIPLAEGAKTYFRNINDNQGINGRKVKIVVEDDHYTIPGSFSAFKKLIFKDRILAMLFCGGTGQVFALMKQIEKHKLPTIPVSLTESLTTPFRQYIFTASGSYDDGLKIIIDYMMKDLKAKNPKVAVVYPDLEFGKSGLQAITRYLPKYNLKVDAKVVLALGAIDATSEVLSLKRLKPDFVILNNAAAAVVSFLKGAKKFGLKSKVIGSYYVGEEELIGSSGEAAKDLLAISPYGFWSDNTEGMISLREITRKYQPKTKKKTRSFTQGWITSMICAEGLKRAGENLNSKTLIEAFETFRNFSTGEISGPVSYSKDNHKGGNTYRVYKTDLENVTFIPITGFREPVIID
ncbi:MAG: ABC transporter substrate-binding protein [Thermodesulfobacteriota bacterium]|nr:ABC transporter substrate-binding protein [Thermodesulfobacteriota bacterium]